MPMEAVSFVTTEVGDDLIVSFAVGDDSTDLESLTLLRTPKYEAVLDDWERGVKVSFGGNTDEDKFLEEVRFDENAAVVRLKTHLGTYELDVRRVDRRELKAMCKVLRKMNFDGRAAIRGLTWRWSGPLRSGLPPAASRPLIADVMRHRTPWVPPT